MTLQLTAPCNFGLEAVLQREIKQLGYEITNTMDGRVSFEGDPLAIARANLWLRTAERVLIKLGEFPATSFEELFQQVRKLPWGALLPVDAAFPVAKVNALKSKLYSVPDIQAITKKAVVEAMKQQYGQQWFAETGAKYPIHVFLWKDVAQIYLDTSGPTLHKRGYRRNQNLAPIKETLAAAMVMLTPWQAGRPFIDPMCGSGTIAIEAALLGKNRAPGILRRFGAEAWPNLADKLWRQARQEAKELERPGDFLLQAYDIDGHTVQMARENARFAGVAEQIHLQQRDVRQLSSADQYGFLVTNPPYGERLSDQETVAALYQEMRPVFDRLSTWSYSIITALPAFEAIWGKPADKRRKLYNGMLKTTLYQYLGPKPPKRPKVAGQDRL